MSSKNPFSSLVIATQNEHKRLELQALLPNVKLRLLPSGYDAPQETGTTFVENATLKAHAAARATGSLAVADDSGIEADALGGAPGVYSARYAGPDATDQQNLDKLIAHVPVGSVLTYICVLVCCDPDGEVLNTFEGRCEGRCAQAPRGNGGFGYDPIFLPAEDQAGRTMAELTAAEKAAISHRGKAARAFADWLLLLGGDF